MEYTEEQKADILKQIEDATKKAVEGLLNQDQVNEVVSKRIKEVNDKHTKDLEEKEKVAKMSAEEKIKHEIESLKASLAEKDSIISSKEKKEQLTSLMGEKKIGQEFYDMFSNVDLDKAGELMDKFNENIKSNIDKGIDDKLKPTVPNTNTGGGDYSEIDAILGIKPIK